MTPIRVVGAALIQRGRCLVAQRGPTMSHALQWEFPGGKIEDGETAAQALARELREELGVQVRVGGWLGRGDVVSGGAHIQLDVYLVELVSGTPQASEHAAVAWLAGAELTALDWAEADRPIVARVIDQLAASGARGGS